MPRHIVSTCFATCFLAICLLPVGPALAQFERSRTSPAAERAAERAAEVAQPAAEKGMPDRSPADKLPLNGRAITFEIVIAEFAKGGKAPAAVDLEAPDKILPKLKELEASGEIGALNRFSLSSVELMPARIQLGERRPVVTGRAAFGGRAPGVVEGPMSYSIESVGTLITALSRVTEDGAVLAEIVVEKTRPSLTPAKVGEPEIARSRSSTLQTQTTVLIPPGKWVVLGGAHNSSEEESTQTIVLVAAKAAEAPKPVSQVNVFYLKHAAASELAKLLSSVFTEKAVRIAFDERTNSLMVSGNDAQIAHIAEMLTKLDAAEKPAKP